MSRNITVTISLPGAWVSEDGTLFLVACPYLPVTREFDAGNRALKEGGYDERITWNPQTMPSGDKPRMENRWVDPLHVTAERWPESAVSKEPVSGWVKLRRIDIGQLETPGKAAT